MNSVNDDKNGQKMVRRNGIFLVIVDSSEELAAAVDTASEFANAEHGYVALLHVIERAHVQSWQNIEDRMRRDMRDQAERMVWEAAGRVVDATGSIPIIYITEGDRSDTIIETIKGNDSIVSLVLASDPHSSNPGPLVSYFSGKGLSRLNVPLMIVPGHLGNSD